MTDARKFPVMACLFLVLLLSAAGCREQLEPGATPVLPSATVRVETLSLSKVPFQIEVAGTVQAVTQASIAARISGPVVEVAVRSGDNVKKGDLLVRISAAELSAQVQQAETQVTQARRNYERESKLLQANASTAETVKSLAERMRIAESAYQEARAMLDYAVVRAPFDGTVTHKLVEVGNLAVPGGVLLRMENSTALEVAVQVPERLVQTLASGARLTLSIPTVGEHIDAEITEIAPTVDPQSRSAQVKLALPDLPALRSGQFARVALPGDGGTTLMIAAPALQHRGQMAQVFVVEQGLARLRLVRTGATYGERIEILAGLQPGEQIVIGTDRRLQDGQPLQIVRAQGQ